jgi:hypothetical protein
MAGLVATLAGVGMLAGGAFGFAGAFKAPPDFEAEAAQIEGRRQPFAIDLSSLPADAGEKERLRAVDQARHDRLVADQRADWQRHRAQGLVFSSKLFAFGLVVVALGAFATSRRYPDVMR